MRRNLSTCCIGNKGTPAKALEGGRELGSFSSFSMQEAPCFPSQVFVLCMWGFVQVSDDLGAEIADSGAEVIKRCTYLPAVLN